MRPRPDRPSARGEALHTSYLVARREFITRGRSRFYLIGTAVFIVLLAGYIVLQALVISKASTTVKMGFAGDSQMLAQPLTAVATTSSLKIETTAVADAQTGEQLVRDGTLDVLVSGDPAAPNVVVKDQLDPTLAATLNALVKQVALDRALASSVANPAGVEAKIAGAHFTLSALDPNAVQRTQREVVGVFVAALLYVALLIYGQIVAAGVVEEKANRIIEILLSTVRPRRLLFGKVTGIGLLGLIQLTLFGTVALITISLTQAINVPNVGAVAVAGGLLWFLLGFLFYALLFAAGASLVSRQEDLGAVSGPLSMLILAPYLAFFWVSANPDKPIGVVLSMLPPFAPVLMPGRMATGDAQAWQIGVAVVLMVAAIGALNALAARIYENSVVRVGSRVKLLDAWRGAP